MTGSSTKIMSPGIILSLFLLAMIWGFSFLFIKIIVSEIDPVVLAAGRIWIAAIFLMPVVMISRRPLNLSPARIRDILIASAVNFCLPYFLIPWGEQFITSGQASILNATMPFSAIILGWTFFRSRPSFGMTMGILVGFSGVVLMAGGVPDALRASQIPGQLAVLLAAFCYAAAAHFIHRRLSDIDLLTLTFLTLVGAGIIILPAFILSGPGQVFNLSQAGLGAWLALGTISTAVAYLLYFYILARSGATATSLVTYLFPAFALFWGWLFLAEQPGLSTIGGAILVFAGIFLASRK